MKRVPGGSGGVEVEVSASEFCFRLGLTPGADITGLDPYPLFPFSVVQRWPLDQHHPQFTYNRRVALVHPGPQLRCHGSTPI